MVFLHSEPIERRKLQRCANSFASSGRTEMVSARLDDEDNDYLMTQAELLHKVQMYVTHFT